jgi:subtilisin family serine protease
VFSGTPTASAHVAGLGALVLQAVPGATPTQVANIIADVAQRGNVIDAGAGSPNVFAQKQNGTCTVVGVYCTGFYGTGGDRFPVINGQYGYAATPGYHKGWLRGTSGTNFNLEIYEWNGVAWILKLTKATSSTNEVISYYSGLSRWYMYKVKSVLGTGTFDIWLERP